MRSLVKMAQDKKKLDPTPEELDQAAKVFRLAGGSWERLYHGSTDDLTLLRRTIKVAVKKGVFSEAQKW
jgi:hypothetical protein